MSSRKARSSLRSRLVISVTLIAGSERSSQTAMSKSQLKPSINPAEYDYEDYSYRQNSMTGYYQEEEEEEDRDYDARKDHRYITRAHYHAPRRYPSYYR